VEKDRQQDIVYSNKMRAGKRRTYFFDIRKTKGEDFYVSITESTKKFNGDGFERHKIFIYKEDFNRFVQSLQDTVNEIKTKYLPDFDYDSFAKRDEEYNEGNSEKKEDDMTW
jgi:hypothetical protein